MATYPFRNSMFGHGLEPRTVELIEYLIDHDQAWCDRDTVIRSLGWIDERMWKRGEENGAFCDARISFAFHYCQANAYLPRFGFYVDMKQSGPQRRELYRIQQIEQRAA